MAIRRSVSRFVADTVAAARGLEHVPCGHVGGHVDVDYLEWNHKIAAHFFRAEMAERPVLLFVTEELLDELGAESHGDWRSFVSQVVAGPAGTPPNASLCQQALGCLARWRNHKIASEYPAYIAYLSLFVLAVGKEGTFAPHAYYPRLRALIGEASRLEPITEAGGSMLPSFDRMWELWVDLEQWATNDRAGALGNFTFRSIGGMVHVGVPLAQTLLTDTERRSLPRIFAEAALDPTSAPSDSELRKCLLRFGEDALRRRTRDLLARAPNTESAILDILVSTVREELEQWDGDVTVQQSSAGAIYGNLRLCATVDSVAGEAQFTLRCSIKRELPDSGLLLKDASGTTRVTCEEALLNWSTPLQDAETHRIVDGARMDWVNGVELREERLGWRFRLRGSKVRVFESGEADGLHGLVEVNQLRRGVPFVLAARAEFWPALEAWGNSECEAFARVPVNQGLPSGWGMFRSAGAHSDDLRNEFPILGFSQTIRLVFCGGLRARLGNAYFRFGLPALRLEGGRGDETVRCDGVELTEQAGVYQVPGGLQAGRTVQCEVVSHGEIVKRHSMFIAEDHDWQRAIPAQLCDAFGMPGEVGQYGTLGVMGASVRGLPDGNPILSPPPECFEGRRVFFIGDVPGQVSSWPKEPFPSDWYPVWAIAMARRGRAIFCGPLSRLTEANGKAALKYDNDAVRLWKDIVYYRRRDIDPPIGTPAVRRLWKRQQEMARHVRT